MNRPGPPPAGKRRKSQRRPRPKAGREKTLEITFLGHRGEGVAKGEPGQEPPRYFIPHTVAGDVVRAEVEGDRGRVLEVLQGGPNRVEPACQYAGACGGCAVQHVRFEAYEAWKRDILQNALQRQRIDVQPEPLMDAHGEGRRRITVHVAITKQGIEAGFMRARHHELVPIETCPVLVPALSNSFIIARDLAQPLHGLCKSLEVQLTATLTGVDCNVVGVSALGYEQHADLTDVARQHDLARLSVNDDPVLIQREPVVTLGHSDVIMPTGGFLQATGQGEDTLSLLVQEGLGQATTIADLFCGIGPFALRLAARASVYAADNNRASLGALSAAANHTQGLKPIETKVRDLFADPLTPSELARFDAVIIDPPRAGARHQARELAQSAVRRIVSVSCDAASFARDARVLMDGGYDLDRVTPVDQFRWAAHVEIVGVFTRG